MGYNTDFSGTLSFRPELTVSRLRELLDLIKVNGYDLELNKEMDALQWNGTEKTYDLDNQINDLIEEMREDGEFEVYDGNLQAVGEEYGDWWRIEPTVDGQVQRVNKNVDHLETVCCPHCGEEFGIEV